MFPSTYPAFYTLKKLPGRPQWNGIPKFSKFVPSEADFYPCFEGGYVRVSVSQLNTLQEDWRISIWGADDCGFELDVPTMDEALSIFNSITWVYGQPERFNVA